MSKIASGKSGPDYTKNLVAARGGKQIVTTYVPIYGETNAVVAILAIDTQPENTSYNMLGPVDLNLCGIVFAVIFAICLLTLLAIKKYLETRDVKAVEVPQEHFVEPTPEPIEVVDVEINQPILEETPTEEVQDEQQQ